ncbi:MAG: DNA mismatch repair endonuclease MutL [Lachnospiraceae bacterium]|nr:DNA mismatch repair endonuclease MutL [Lachnospiraceae bacterium]
MSKIELLDEATINKIAAGEVVERPLSVVKELVENSIDSGADSITIEIRGGGIDFIRVTDNGSGIPADEVRLAFTPHATSKIRSADDLFDVRSLGFRGEALSTIAAVAQVEMVTKTKEGLTGVLYKIDGGREVSYEEVGAGEGTTFIARNLFLHVPARRKFLKSAMTEAGYITEFVQKIAIERSDIAFKYVVNNDNKLVTTGNGSVKDNIYRVYGRDISDSILPVNASDNGMSIAGYIAKPIVARNNRNLEIFFVNGHAVSDKILEKAVEAAYKPFLMQHKFPFVYLFLSLDPGMVDVNVHPRKSEVKFSLGSTVYDFVERSAEAVLKGVELINKVELAPDKKEVYKTEKKAPEPFERQRAEDTAAGKEKAGSYDDIIDRLNNIDNDNAGTGNTGFFVETGELYPTEPAAVKNDSAPEGNTFVQDFVREASGADEYLYESRISESGVAGEKETSKNKQDIHKEIKADQLDLFEEKIIKPSNKPDFNIIGCVFDTYWIIEYKDKMIMTDQHAAHEKVMYERFVKEYKDRKVVSQYVNPPVLITVTGRQEETIEKYAEAFTSLGFEIEKFEGNEYALRAVPSGFMKLENKEIFMGLLDELTETTIDTADVSVINDRLAQMSCKAAVKGGNRLSLMEADELLTELLSLENPYNCPHGRPTMVEFSERDLEKFFKRIV